MKKMIAKDHSFLGVLAFQNTKYALNRISSEYFENSLGRDLIIYFTAITSTWWIILLLTSLFYRQTNNLACIAV